MKKIKIDENESSALKGGNSKNSLRTTIPAKVRDNLKIKKGDKIRWETFVENEKIYAKVTKK